MMTCPILVTGGAGYIGSHVCKALAEAGFLPVTYDNLSGGHRWAVRWGPLEVGDLADQARLKAVMTAWQPAAVIHFAGFIAAGESVTDPAKYYENNVGGILGLLSAMRCCEIEHIVFSSTAAVYGVPHFGPIREDHPKMPINPYGRSKLISENILEDYARAYGIGSVALRYFNAAGGDPEGEIGEAHDPETHLIPIVLETAAGLRKQVSLFGDTYDTPDGTCIRDYVHVCDLAMAHVAALRWLGPNPGAHAFNLGNGAGFSVREVIAAGERVTGQMIPVRVEEAREGDPPVLVANSDLAASILGWRPQFADLDTQITHAWNWMACRRQIEKSAVRTIDARPAARAANL